MSPPSEVALAQPLVEYLREMDLEVYQEVSLPIGIADIVAVHQGKRVHVIECKKSLTFGVLAQASRWRPYAHWCSVAVPSTVRPNNGRLFAHEVARNEGLGVFEISGIKVISKASPCLNRRARVEYIQSRLCEEQKTEFPAGGIGYWTPFKRTCRELARFVSKNPGCSLKQAVEGIEHHYRRESTARACLAQQAKEGRIPHVKVRRSGKRITLFPEKN
ncbi:MAG: DNA repair protein MmcB-related protein [Planctomycetota bacterium]|nr:MAG: DNA repair protein MmcB-related protein [Planctomycetota bacterium]